MKKKYIYKNLKQEKAKKKTQRKLNKSKRIIFLIKSNMGVFF